MTYSYNDNILPHKIRGEYISEVEKQLLRSEENKEVADLFRDICSSGPELRYARIAQKIKSLGNIDSPSKMYQYQMLVKVCAKFRLIIDLTSAKRLLESEREYARVIKRIV